MARILVVDDAAFMRVRASKVLEDNGHEVALAENELSAIVREAPKFTEAHVLLATAYYRLKRKEDGDRERAVVQKLNAETQAAQPKGEPLQPEKK